MAIFPAPACIYVGLPHNELTFSWPKQWKGLPLKIQKAFQGSKLSHLLKENTVFFFDSDMPKWDLLQCILTIQSILNVIIHLCFFCVCLHLLDIRVLSWQFGYFYQMSVFLKTNAKFTADCLRRHLSELILVRFRSNWSHAEYRDMTLFNCKKKRFSK